MKNIIMIGVASSLFLLAAALVLPQFGRTVVFEAFVLLVAGIALATLLPALGGGRERKRRAWWRRRKDQTAPPSWLLRHQSLVTGATRDTVSADMRLLEELRNLAAERLSAKHRVDMAMDLDATRHLLGDEAWEVLRPDWAAGRGAWDPGVTLEEIDTAVSAIERL